jgi:hypothetical protein
VQRGVSRSGVMQLRGGGGLRGSRSPTLASSCATLAAGSLSLRRLSAATVESSAHGWRQGQP